MNKPLNVFHPRLTGLRMMSAGIICFLIYQTMGWPEGYWSVITVSAITQATLADTMLKAMLRLIGTCLGASLGFLLAYFITDNPIWLSSIFFIFLTVTTYIGLQTKPYNYAAVVTGFTAVVVISSKAMGDLQDVAIFRTLEVIFAIIIYALINLMVACLQNAQSRLSPGTIKEKIYQVYGQIHWFKPTFLSALLISSTCTLTYASWLIWRYPYGYWATITLIIIMEDSYKQTKSKSIIRFVGQLLAAIAGLMVAFYANGDILVTGLALAVGFFFCGCIIGSQSSLAAVGNHAGSAIAIMLLVGLEKGTETIVLWRFINVVVGIMIANLVLQIDGWIQHRKTAVTRHPDV